MLRFKNSRKPDCICVKIQGGLGNQMFQYAAGLSAAKRLNSDLLLELPAIGPDDHANFGLEIFDMDIDCFKLRKRTGNFGKFLLSKIQFWRSQLNRPKYASDPDSVNAWYGSTYKQPEFIFDVGFEKIMTPCLLEGYFQSYKYFNGIEDEIRQSFKLNHYESQIGRELRSVCKSKNSVSVHIRRGDYANNPKITSVHGLIDKEYYDQAKNVLMETNKNRNFVVFSDDSATARQITSDWPNVFIAEGNSREVDLLAMASCQDNIIANSTFSWWGAWLNPNPNKIVITPKKWLVDVQSNELITADLFPKTWIKL